MAAPPFKVKALFKYDSGYEGDLNFPDGEILTVTAKEDEDWYFGEYVDASGAKQEGIFPMNFVERYEPETPPRPVRPSRPKKEVEPVRSPTADTEPPPYSVIERKDAEEVAKEPASSKSTSQNTKSGQGPGKAGQPASPKSTISADPPQKLADTQEGTSINKAAPKPPVGTKKEIPGSAPADKVGGSTFRDRIAAFNKPAAPPVAPFKPGGLSSGFIKKPFVAPPPSKNSYVPIPREPPPQKVYRREEDPEIANRTSQDNGHADKASPPALAQNPDDTEDQPKPTSLKERIALLQKQQLEQQARHAEALLKKEKPKRPQKKRVDSHEGAEDQTDARGADLEKQDNTEVAGKRSLESSREEGSATGKPSARRKPSRESSQMDIPVYTTRAMTSDADDADQSGVGEDVGEISTGRDDSDEPSKAFTPGPKVQKPPGHGASAGGEENTEDEEEEGEEEEIDPEVKRRMEIRERMAKMSGGMGMYGMFGPPGGVPPIPTGAPKKKKVDKRGSGGTGDDAVSGAPQALAPALALPGMHPKPRSPEEPDKRLMVEKNGEIAPLSPDAERGAPDIGDAKRDLPHIPPRLDRTPPSPQGEILLSSTSRQLAISEHELTSLVERPVPPPLPPTEKTASPAVPGERGAPPPPPVEGE
jgi:myosin tail region-interacting protein MTI1